MAVMTDTGADNALDSTQTQDIDEGGADATGGFANFDERSMVQAFQKARGADTSAKEVTTTVADDAGEADDIVIDEAPVEGVEQDDDLDLFAHLDGGAAPASKGAQVKTQELSPEVAALIEQNKKLMQLLERAGGQVPTPTKTDSTPTTEVDPMGDDFVGKALAQHLGTDSVPTELLEAWRRAYSLKALSGNKGWDSEQVKSSIEAAEKHARELMSRYKSESGLRRELEDLKAATVNKYDPQEAVQKAGDEFVQSAKTGALDASYPVIARLSKAGAARELGKALATAAGERYGSMSTEDYAKWLDAASAQVTPVVEAMEQDPGNIERDLRILKASAPAIHAVVEPYAKKLAARHAKLGGKKGGRGGLEAAGKRAAKGPGQLRSTGGGHTAQKAAQGRLLEGGQGDIEKMMVANFHANLGRQQ